ncbi:MAG: chemotaxis protein histidine kinase CheA [Bradymonadia bacterium]|jgi:chemotaxis protein histidine kinase CheA
MPISAEELAARVKRLRLAYTQNLPDQIQKISTRVTALAANWNEEVGDEAAHFSHNLAGTGQTFGFPVVGKAARKLEHQLMTCKQQQAPSPSLMDALNELLSAAEDAGVPAEVR